MRTRRGEERAREARLRWDRENLGYIGARFSKREVRAFRELCANGGTTMYAFVKELVRECIRYGSIDFFIVPIPPGGNPTAGKATD